MDWLNYHHLYYFYTVAKEGGLTKAAEKLKLSPPTLHAQLKSFQEVCAVKLLQKSGKKLVLTEQGKVFYQYADNIFSLGNELSQFVKTGGLKEKKKLAIGIELSLYKGSCFELIRSICHHGQDMNLKIYQDNTDKLLQRLNSLEIDLLFTNHPLVHSGPQKLYNHLLGQSRLAVYSHVESAQRLKKNFPKSLNGIPFLVPTLQHYLRNMLEQWFVDEGIRPMVWAEIEGSALTKLFAAEQFGVMVAPSLAERELKGHNLIKIGELKESFESYYMVSAERKVKNPLALELLEANRKGMRLF